MLVHPIDALYNERSEILILGSFPSVKSREEGFFYGHPANRFWRVMARVCECPPPVTINEKKNLILNNGFALWDVIHSCEIKGSADNTIKNVVANDIGFIIKNSSIDKIFVNGRKAEELYKKYIERKVGIAACALPSTSSANAAWNEDRLFECWKKQLGK